MRRVTVLFARKNSHYKHLFGTDVYDVERDARTWPGGDVLVAHPPCRGWGRLRHFAKPREDELELAVWAMSQVRSWGGVLEHPVSSQLWHHMSCRPAGQLDVHGGFLLPVLQSWWGHRAPKSTMLYVVGCRPSMVPSMPFELGAPLGRVELMCKAERERTPHQFAQWLVDLAEMCRG